MLARSDLIQTIKSVLEASDAFSATGSSESTPISTSQSPQAIRLRRPLLRTQPLRDFLLRTEPLSDCLASAGMNPEDGQDDIPILSQIECAGLFVTLVSTFHDDLEHEALRMLYNYELRQTMDDKFAVFRAFIRLHNAGLLQVSNVDTLLKFDSKYEIGELDPNEQILAKLNEFNLLNQTYFDMIFSASILEELDVFYTLPNKALTELCVQFRTYLSPEVLASLSRQPEKCVKAFELIEDLIRWGIATPAVYTALSVKIDHCEKMSDILSSLDDRMGDDGFPQFQTEECMIALSQSAEYFANFYILLSYSNEDNLLNHDNFVKLCHYHAATNGMIRTVLNAMRITLDGNLLTSDNFHKLSAILPHIKTASAAIAVLNFTHKLSQSLLDEIISQPIHALFIAARCIGIPQLRLITNNINFDTDYHPTASTTIKTFIDVGSASRYFYGPLFRAQRHALASSPALLPDDILHKIMTHIGDNEALEDKTMQHTLHSCRFK